MQLKVNRQALKVAMIYVIVACGWTVGSDAILKRFARSVDQSLEIDTIKDWSFMVLMGLFLYHILQHILGKSEREMEQRKASEENLHRTERALKTISACNGVLVRATSEARLLSEICQVVVEKSGYAMAWVGFAEYDEKKSVRIAIRTGQFSLSHDFQTDPKTTPWRTEGAKRGYASAISLPLQAADKTFGALTIYAAESNAFNLAEIELLKELAEDLAYGIQALRARVEHEQAEATLHESEKKFSKLFHSSPVAMSLSTVKEGRFLDVNDEFVEVLQRSREEIVGRTAFELNVWAHPESRAEVIARLKAQETVRNLEIEILNKAGQIRQILWSVEEIVIGSENCWLGSALDITEKKLAERKLRENESFVRNVLDSLSAHIAVLDDAGNIVAVNQAWRRFAGENDAKEQDVHLGVNYLAACRGNGDLSRDRFAQSALDGVQAVLAGTQTTFTIEYPCHSQRAQAWFCMRVWRLEGARRGVVVAHENITDRKHAEDQVNLQLSALTAAANSILITDARGKIQWVNPAFTKSTGYTAEEIIGRTPSVLKSGRQQAKFYADMWQTIRAGKVWRGELSNKRKDGTFYSEEMTITPVRGADDLIAHYVAIKQDVTERRRFENRMQQAQKMEAIGTLAGGIAHDFNNILAAMFGFGSLLQQETEDNPATQEYVGEILKATVRAQDLVKQILTFSRQSEQKRQVIRLDCVIKEAMKFLRASLPAEIKIETSLAADAPPVLADPTKIYQIAINLATNAHHAMEGRSGILRVSLDSFSPDESFIRSHPDFRPVQHARLVFADNGHGMDAKTMERIFEPFYTTKPVGKGTGLGLAVVHGIVQSHEGLITIASRPGEGATFSLYFPAKANDAVVAPDTAVGLITGQGQHILLVDDEPALTSMFRKMLSRLNYEVTVSSNARDALARFRQQPTRFDLVITDLTMPEMNGLEVARQIHALHPNMPVILASGFSANTNSESIAAAGICELIEKPVSYPTLATAVHRALTKPKELPISTEDRGHSHNR
jgi:PAS domain S-box-containing protein